MHTGDPVKSIMHNLGISGAHVPLHDARRQRGRTAHVHDGHRQLAGQVVGDPCGDRAAEENRGALGRHLLRTAIPARQPVGDAQGRQRQGDQGRDPVADAQPERGLRTDLVDDADEHPARARDRVLHLAASADDLEHFGPHGVAVTGVLGGELAKGCGVEVQQLDAYAQLVGGQRRIGVEPLGRLRQRSGGLEDAVQPDGRGGGAVGHRCPSGLVGLSNYCMIDFGVGEIPGTA